MWISKMRYDTLVRNGNWNAEERSADDEWHRTFAAQLKALAEGQQRLTEFVGSNQAVLDTLVQRLGDTELATRVALTAMSHNIELYRNQTRTEMWRLQTLLRTQKPRANGKRKR